MKEYTVKVKDRRQGITHVLHQYAESQNHANVLILGILKKLLGYDDFEII